MANGRLWTKREVYRLMGMAETLSQEEAARRLGRTPESIKTKVRMLGIRWRQGRTSLRDLAREYGCSEVTVSRVANLLFWSERVTSKPKRGKKANGRRYHLDEQQTERLRAVLERNLKQYAQNREAGRRRHTNGDSDTTPPA